MISTICVPLVKAKKTIEVLTMHTGRLESYLLIQSGYNLLISAVEDWDTRFTTGNTGRVSRTTFAYIKLSLKFLLLQKNPCKQIPLSHWSKQRRKAHRMNRCIHGSGDAQTLSIKSVGRRQQDSTSPLSCSNSDQRHLVDNGGGGKRRPWRKQARDYIILKKRGRGRRRQRSMSEINRGEKRSLEAEQVTPKKRKQGDRVPEQDRQESSRR